jgi:hypothetical protein
MRVRQMVAGEVRIVLALQALEYVHVANRKDEVVRRLAEDDSGHFPARRWIV